MISHPSEQISPATSVEDDTDTPNRKRNWKRRVTAVTAMAVLAAGLSGCGGNTVSAKIVPKAPVTTSAPNGAGVMAPSPEAAPTPVAAETTSPEGAALVAAYETLPIDQFNELPRDQRLKVVYDIYNTIGQGYLTEYMGEVLSDGKAIYDHNPAVQQAYPTDNGALIVAQNGFANSAAAAYKQNYTVPGGGPINLNGAEQLMSGVTYNVGEKDTTGQYKEMVSILTQNVNAQKLPNMAGIIALDTSPLQTGVDKEGKSIQYKDVLVTAYGNTEKTREVFTTFPDKDGVPRSMWLVESSVKATSLK